MITKALPIPVVTPFSYISGHQALSLPFILFDLAVALSRRSRTSRIHKTIRFKKFVKAVLLFAGTAFFVELIRLSRLCSLCIIAIIKKYARKYESKDNGNI